MDKKLNDALELRRTVKEVKRYVIVTRFISIMIVVLIAIIAITYGFSYFYDKYGSFTVKISKYDMINQGLALSETPEYTESLASLSADIVYEMSNISGEDLPDNIDAVNGSHNGKNYIAYTFYLINSGESTLSYESNIAIENVTKSVDEAVRVAVFKNGEKTVYAKTKKNGSGPEAGTVEFISATSVLKSLDENFKPDSRDKYTVVIWLEGNDPDCVDEIIGGTLKLKMNFKIVESS